LELRNSRPTSFCCQLLRCLECTLSWCTRSVHAVNGRVHGTGCKHGRVGAAAAFESRTDHVHGPYAVCTRAWTAVYTGHRQVHVHGTWPRTRAVNTAVSIDSTRPFTGRVLYTGRKHGRVPCTRPCLRTTHGRVHNTYTAVHTGRKDGRVDGRVHGTRPVHGHV